MVDESQPVKVDGDSPTTSSGSVAPWMLVLVGLVSGVGLTVVFDVTGGDPTDPGPIPTLEPATATSSTVPAIATGSTIPESGSPATVGPSGMEVGPVWVVTGEYPNTMAQRWSSGQIDDGFGLPWASAGFGTDASGDLYGFTQPSATARSLFVGGDGRYVALSATVLSWRWHATEPATLVWVDTSQPEPIVMVTRIDLEPVGDRGEGLEAAAESSPLITARPNESVLGFTDAGVVLGALNPAAEEPAARVVDSSGEVVAETDASRVVADSFSPDGWGLVETETSLEGRAAEYQIVDSALEGVAELGSHQRIGGGGVGWSPDGETLAIVEYRGEREVDVHLELWNRRGELLDDLPLRHRVWDVTWMPDGSQIVMAAIGNPGWHGLLFVDPASGEVIPVEAGADDVVAVAVASD